MNWEQLIWVVVVVYGGIGLFVFVLAVWGARTARERRYAVTIAVFWPWLFGRRP